MNTPQREYRYFNLVMVVKRRCNNGRADVDADAGAPMMMRRTRIRLGGDQRQRSDPAQDTYAR